MDQLTFSDFQCCTQMEVADTAGISQQIQQFSEWETEKTDNLHVLGIQQLTIPVS